MFMDKTFHEMLHFAQRSGKLAVDVRNRGFTVEHKGADLAQALTEADKGVSRIAQEMFSGCLVSEETSEGRNYELARKLLKGPEVSFVVDEIDGTKPFAGRRWDWGTQIAACQGGRILGGVLSLPCWNTPRHELTRDFVTHRGLLLAAWGGRAYMCETVNGGINRDLLEGLPTFTRPTHPSYHVGWLALAAMWYNIDHTKGLFPVCESGCISDFAQTIVGNQDCTTFNSKLWDAFPAIPILQAVGFQWYQYAYDVANRKSYVDGGLPEDLTDMFDSSFKSKELWMVCRNHEQAGKLAASILPSYTFLEETA